MYQERQLTKSLKPCRVPLSLTTLSNLKHMTLLTLVLLVMISRFCHFFFMNLPYNPATSRCNTETLLKRNEFINFYYLCSKRARKRKNATIFSGLMNFIRQRCRVINIHKSRSFYFLIHFFANWVVQNMLICLKGKKKKFKCKENIQLITLHTLRVPE